MMALNPNTKTHRDKWAALKRGGRTEQLEITLEGLLQTEKKKRPVKVDKGERP